MITRKEIDGVNLGGKKQIKLSCGGRLFLLCRSSGSKSWQFDYVFAGKNKTATFGHYPAISIDDACRAHLEAKSLLYKGIDPNEVKKSAKAAAVAVIEHTFEKAFEGWFKREVKAEAWIPRHANKVRAVFESDVLPFIGRRQLSDITTPDLVKVVKKVVARDALDVAARIQARFVRIFDFGIQHGMCTENPAIRMSGIVRRKKTVHHPAVPAGEVGKLVYDIQNVKGRTRKITKLCALFAIHTFARSTEFRLARWSEINFFTKQWTIPAIRDEKTKGGGMKMRLEHVVPLSAQAIAILNEIRDLDLDNDLIFPAVTRGGKSLSENTINDFLDVVGYGGKQTVHGFRTIASTILNERAKRDGVSFDSDVIELQLAHSSSKKNDVRDAYNRAEYVEIREEMMQWYSDELDQLADVAASKIKPLVNQPLPEIRLAA